MTIRELFYWIQGDQMIRVVDADGIGYMSHPEKYLVADYADKHAHLFAHSPSMDWNVVGIEANGKNKLTIYAKV